MVKFSLMLERVLSKVDMLLVLGSDLLSMMDMLLVLQTGSYLLHPVVWKEGVFLIGQPFSPPGVYSKVII